ncbi:MAG: hypothetical protein HKN74_14575 [Acidimicrobiia bacterium]|nr:hypothetical protein [Acidimicrobiia bacterium]NNF11498.1 hypothetical protein [Acidimicrobiia bacterium]NNL68908.1 hypothetical protein [Acidimicrobiia bacterium]
MDATGSALHSAFVGGFGPYLKAILDERGLPHLDDDTVQAATEWLDDELRTLLDQPFHLQDRSPLELVQQAMEGPTGALRAAGVKAPLRDPVSVAALPGDHYGLAPASSAALGEEAFHAHLAWGAAKASALAPLVTGGRPVLLLSGDLMDRSRFEEAVREVGLRLATSSDDGLRPLVAFVDLKHPDADDLIRTLAADGVEVIAYGPHVDSDALTRARTLGAQTVLARSRLMRAITDHLPRRT